MERLRGGAFFPTQLEGINWRLNLSMAQPSQDKMKLPNAQFEFGIKTGEVTVSGLVEALLCVLHVTWCNVHTHTHTDTHTHTHTISKFCIQPKRSIECMMPYLPLLFLH